MISICCVTDDKPGHKSQLEGLLAALERRCKTRVQWLHIQRQDRIEAPLDLILCAGRRTHWPALKLRKQLGGRVIALTRSLFPLWLFDLSILPRHDGVAEGARVFNTVGSLNGVTASAEHNPDRGLILIGGPSKNHAWNDAALLQQLQTLTRSGPRIDWTLTTSRRTPASLLAQLEQWQGSEFKVVPHTETDREWLLQRYADSGVIWVTEDSVSMVSEALSSGAIVGILQVPRRKSSRVSGYLDSLIADNYLLTLDDAARNGLPDKPPQPPLREADRAADRLLQWLRTQQRSVS